MESILFRAADHQDGHADKQGQAASTGRTLRQPLLAFLSNGLSVACIILTAGVSLFPLHHAVVA